MPTKYFSSRLSSALKWGMPFLFIVFFSACNQQPTAVDPEPFELPISIPLGKKPVTVVAHDMNNDGYPDLLTPNTEDNNLYYFEGYGDGSFKQPFKMKTGKEPVAMDVGDFNSDGIPDIAVANYGEDNISIILGQKDGVFKRGENVSLGQLRLPIAIRTGDFNNDRKPDLVVSMRFDKLVILLGSGDGKFKVAESYHADGNPASIAVGDFNNDSFDDFAIAFNGVKVNYIRVFIGKGDGTFNSPERVPGGKQSTFITTADINRDNNLDLVIASPLTDSLTPFINDGKGHFTKTDDFAAEKGPNTVIAGEFTGDGVDDLIVTNSRDASISVLQGRGDGTFIFPHFNYAIGVGPKAMAAADFNKDGLLDLALVLYEKSILAVLMRKIDRNTSPS